LNPGESWTIGGVIGDMRESSLVDEAEPTVYQSSLHAGRHPTRFWLMARARHSTGAAVTAVQEVVRAADPSIAPDFRTLDDHLARYSARPRFFAVILVCFTAFTLLLSGAGIATTLDSYVAHRTAEIGIRVALGASPTSLTLLIMRRITLLLGAAAVAGLWVGASLLQFTGSLVVPDSGTHMPWVTYAVPAATIIVIGLGASIAPLRRALSREPLEALRSV
jgi:putative ABC transport system permease protein